MPLAPPAGPAWQPIHPLNRDALADRSFGRRLALPPELAWSEQQLEQSLAEVLAARPAGPARVFGYGSLMWNPLLAHVERRVATLAGWRRSFCLRTVVGRGRPERPGRMLSLEPGGSVQGVALRLAEDELVHELRLLWRREMAMGAYRPLWLPLQLDGGEPADALVFVARTDHPMYEADASVDTVARLVAVASGAFGSNADYLRELARSLAQLGLGDPRVDELLAAVSTLAPPAVDR